jgi:hypothetical protein
MANKQPATYDPEIIEDELNDVKAAWRRSQVGRKRNRIYCYLREVYVLRERWWGESRIGPCSRIALKLFKRTHLLNKLSGFSAILICTSEPEDDTYRAEVNLQKDRSRWLHALIAASEVNVPSKELEKFIKQFGGLNGLNKATNNLQRNRKNFKDFVEEAGGMQRLLEMDRDSLQELVRKASKLKRK